MFDLPKYGDGICLARLAALLEALGIDRPRLSRGSIVVTGSNGKGSTAAFAASIGRASGLRTGLFTSPHFYRINERFKIGGEDIDDATLSALVARVSTAIAALPHEHFGAFEAQFALACLYFQNEACKLTVFEAGIGGRFDPVRLVGADITCVTSVDYEHVDLLGPSLQAIVADKSDACAAGGTTIYGENCRALAPHIVEYNRARDVASLFIGQRIAIDKTATSATGQSFDLIVDTTHIEALTIALPGRFQINNAAIAAALSMLWIARERPDADPATIETAIRTGLRDARWPGRLETIAHDPLVVIDVGHTPDGVAQALAGLFATHGRDNWILVLGTSRDKDITAIATTLAPAFDTIVCTAAHHKGAAAGMVADAARAANANADIQIAPDIAQAVVMSREIARRSGHRIYVAGGLFVAIEYAHALAGGDPDRLIFF